MTTPNDTSPKFTGEDFLSLNPVERVHAARAANNKLRSWACDEGPIGMEYVLVRLLRGEYTHLKQIKGVACLEGHDLCHSFACGRCYEKLREENARLRKALRIEATCPVCLSLTCNHYGGEYDNARNALKKVKK